MTGTKLRTELLLFSLFTTLELEAVEELLDELDDVEDAFTLFDDRARLEELITLDELELEEDFTTLDELELDCEDELDELDFLDEPDELTAFF